MVCRNPERGEQAKRDIVSESGNDVSSVPLLFLDRLWKMNLLKCQ